MGNLGTTFTGLSGKNKDDFGHGNAKYVTYMNVFSNTIANEKQLEKIETDNRQNSVLYGDVFFTTSSETPEEVGMSSVWLSKEKNVYLNSFCFGFRPTVQISPYFFAYLLRSSGTRNQFILLAQGISRYNISKNKAMNILINYPKNDEQVQIGNYFKLIDNQITLHRRKCLIL